MKITLKLENALRAWVTQDQIKPFGRRSVMMYSFNESIEIIYPRPTDTLLDMYMEYVMPLEYVTPSILSMLLEGGTSDRTLVYKMFLNIANENLKVAV